MSYSPTEIPVQSRDNPSVTETRIKVPKRDTRAPWRKKLDDDIAFGLEQTFFCFVTDFIDPFVGGRVQNMHDVWKDIDAKLPVGQKLKTAWVESKGKNVEKREILEKVNQYNQTCTIEDHQPKKSAFRHALEGEVMGDLTAIAGFVAMRQWLPQPIEWTRKAFLYLGDRKLEKVAKKELKNWAFKEQLDEGSEKYRTKVEEWKNSYADDMAKSSAMSFWSTVNNIGFQRWGGNDRPLWVIGASKGLGAAITWATMVGVRFLMPKTMNEMDEELSKRYIAPAINFITGKKNKSAVPETVDATPEMKEPKLDSSIAFVKDAQIDRLQPAPSVAAHTNV